MNLNIKDLAVDERIALDLVARYGHITEPALARTLDRQEHSHERTSDQHLESDSRASNVLKSLCYFRLVSECILPGNQTAFVLTNRGNRILNVLSESTTPAKGKQLIRQLAMMSFCLLGNPARSRLMPGENEDLLCWSEPNVKRRLFYVVPSSLPTLGLLRVEAGGTGRWDRILSKAMQDVRLLLNYRARKPSSDSFTPEVTIALATVSKARRIAMALRSTPVPLPIRIAILPQLFELLTPRPLD